MSAPLVFVELADGQPTPGSVGLLACARGATGDAHAVVLGPGAEAAAAGLAAHGASVAWHAASPSFDPDLPAPAVEALRQLVQAEDYALVLFENSVLAADVAAGLAAALEAGVNWDVVGLELRDGTPVGQRLALDDSLAVAVGWTTARAIAVWRAGTADAAADAVAGEVRAFAPELGGAAGVVSVVERRPAAGGDSATLASADVIVAGGRGLRDRDQLALLEALAAELHGAVGVSLPIVDRGWYPPSRQVGQTGNKVRPRVYLACGISGSLAHRVGMERSGCIVAINTDPAAPIFGICDIGLVGDLHEVVPEMTRLLRERAAAHAGA